MLVRYHPFRTVARRDPWFTRVWDDDVFEALWGRLGRMQGDQPKIEWQEGKKSYLLRGEFPGFDRDEVKVEVEDGVLTLRADHKEEKWDQDEDEGWRSIETRKGGYTRYVRLPEDVNVEAIQAEMKQGVLRITLPKERKPADEARQIEIR